MKRPIALALTVAALGWLAVRPTLIGADTALNADTLGEVEGPVVLQREVPAPVDAPRQLPKVIQRDELLSVPVNDGGEPLLGDWDGDGVATPGLWFANGTWGALRLPSGSIHAAAGSADGTPVVGDWNGDGKETVATWDEPVLPGVAVVAGDWEGDGIDEIAVVPQPAGTTVVAGDWDADGADTIGHVVIDADLKARITFPFDDAQAVEIDVAPDSKVLSGVFDREVVAEDLRRLRRLAPTRLPNRGVETIPGAPAPDGSIIELRRVWGITTEASMSGQLEALLTAAYLDGIHLAGWGWRSHEQQIELRRAHCGDSHYGIWEAPASSCGPPTARPGSSRHEFGRAVDFTENGVVLTRSSPGFLWLKEHAADFGFINLPSEPWHWSDTGG